MNLFDYLHEVEDILESFDYPALVSEFAPEDVAKSMSNAVIKFFQMGMSTRYCAIAIWSLTMNYQIIPQSKEATKH